MDRTGFRIVAVTTDPCDPDCDHDEGDGCWVIVGQREAADDQVAGLTERVNARYTNLICKRPIDEGL